MDEYDEWADYEEPAEQERPRDTAIDRAREAILEFLAERDREVFYGRQMEVALERDFFHWITDFALSELIDEGEIEVERVELERGKGVWVQFVFERGHRYRKRQIRRAIEVLRDLARVAGPCGVYAELLFKLAFMKRGFDLVGEGGREYRGNVWTRSGHDLDFFLEKDGQAYGVEVKNRLVYIEREELAIKMEMCRHLGVAPVFVMRAAAKSYNYAVIKAGGFALIFETQIYPPGQEELVERIRRVLGFPVVCSKAIPERTLDRFGRWHDRRVGKV